LNLSKTGISTTIGRPGANVNLGKRGTYLNLGVPGTGISYREKIDLQAPASQASVPGTRSKPLCTVPGPSQNIGAQTSKLPSWLAAPSVLPPPNQYPLDSQAAHKNHVSLVWRTILITSIIGLLTTIALGTNYRGSFTILIGGLVWFLLSGMFAIRALKKQTLSVSLILLISVAFLNMIFAVVLLIFVLG
jgi:hypothetical protein